MFTYPPASPENVLRYIQMCQRFNRYPHSDRCWIRLHITKENADPALHRLMFGMADEAWYCGELTELVNGQGDTVGYQAYCVVEEGDCGDEDGFGVESDIWAVGTLDAKGRLLAPFMDPNTRQYERFIVDFIRRTNGSVTRQLFGMAY